MRLPARTKQQQCNEANRAFHEALYRQWSEGGAVVSVPVKDLYFIGDQQVSISSNTRHFWSSRGFRVRTAQHKEDEVIVVWLEPMDPKPVRKNRAA